MAKRKYIRIAMSDEDMAALAKAKASFEKQTGVAISDSMYVLSVLRQSIKEMRQG